MWNGFQCGDCRGTLRRAPYPRSSDSSFGRGCPKGGFAKIRQSIGGRYSWVSRRTGGKQTKMSEILSRHPWDSTIPFQFQTHPAWSKILPFLELVELESFAKSHPRLRKIVNSFLEQGGKQIIKLRFNRRYEDTTILSTESAQKSWSWKWEMERFEMVKSLPKLKCLPIVGSTNAEFRDRIIALKLESYDV